MTESTLDKAFSIGASADLITPLLSMLGNALGWWRHFSVPRALYPDVHMLMQQKRIPMRNWQRIDDVCTFDIDAGVAPLVAELLRQHWGVEFTRPPRWLTKPQRTKRRRTRRR